MKEKTQLKPIWVKPKTHLKVYREKAKRTKVGKKFTYDDLINDLIDNGKKTTITSDTNQG